MANTTTSTESNAKTGARSFRSVAEIENLYRFVHENNLRLEAKMILDAAYLALGGKIKKSKSKSKKSKRKLH